MSDQTAFEVSNLKSELSGLNGQLSDAARSHNQAAYQRLMDVINHVKQELEHAQARHAEALVHDAQVAKWSTIYGVQSAGEALAAHMTSGQGALVSKARSASLTSRVAETLYAPKPSDASQGSTALARARKNAADTAAAARETAA